MAIPCPSCGREYDVTLFQFGRTVHCTCGARVGLEKRIPLSGASFREREEPRFFVDAMLGRLARWLRVLGFDAAYDAAIEDEALVRRALEDGRRIVTRDTRLPEEWRVEGVLLVRRDDPLEQLLEVVGAMGWDAGALLERELFTRCLECNSELEDVKPEEVAEEVPERVLERQDRFVRCPSCGGVYWEGSHVRRMRRKLRDALGGDG